MRHPEYQYLDLVQEILEKDFKKVDRTGTETLSIFGAMMRYSLKDSTFPLLTTKKAFYKGVVEELLFFLQAETDARVLGSKGVKIWEKNSTKEYLNSVGIEREAEDLGPVYGFQWRHFGAKYSNCHVSYEGQGVGQIKDVIRLIKRDPTSRRMVMSA